MENADAIKYLLSHLLIKMICVLLALGNDGSGGGGAKANPVALINSEMNIPSSIHQDSGTRKQPWRTMKYYHIAYSKSCWYGQDFHTLLSVIIMKWRLKVIQHDCWLLGRIPSKKNSSIWTSSFGSSPSKCKIHSLWNFSMLYSRSRSVLSPSFLLFRQPAMQPSCSPELLNHPYKAIAIDKYRAIGKPFSTLVTKTSLLQ